MANLAMIAETMLINKIANAPSPISAKGDPGQIFVVMSGTLAAVGLGFIILASYLWLNANYQPDIAAAMTGVISFAVAALMGAVALGIMKYRQSVIKKVRRDVMDTISAAVDSIDGVLDEPVGNNPKTAATLALLAGYLVSDKIL